VSTSGSKSQILLRYLVRTSSEPARVMEFGFNGPGSTCLMVCVLRRCIVAKRL